MEPENIQGLTDTISEELEGNLMEMSASEPVPHDKKENTEAAVPENKLTFRQSTIAEEFLLFKSAFNFFYNMESSMLQALKLNSGRIGAM